MGSTREWLAWEASALRMRRGAERDLARIARAERIVAGPWLGEVGVELLFWIPFLNWFRERYGVGRERIVAISRGGADLWYRDIAAGYVDVLDHFGLDELASWGEERLREGGTQKQKRVAEADRRVLEASTETIGASGYGLLHPSVMHRLFTSFWRWRTGENRLATVLSRTSFRPLPKPAGPAPAGLPDRYIALKAYFNNSFPDTEANRAFLAELVSTLTEATDVVLLDTAFQPDDHGLFRPEAAGRLHSAAGLMRPRDNLEMQTRVIAGARALVGTVGGFSYLACFLGVPSFSFNSDDEFFVPTHRDLMERAARTLTAGGHPTSFVHMPVEGARELLALAAGSRA